MTNAVTKTEAAEIVANEVLVFARKHGRTPNKELVEARISELRGTAAGSLLGDAAEIAHWRTTLGIAQRWF